MLHNCVPASPWKDLIGNRLPTNDVHLPISNANSRQTHDFHVKLVVCYVQANKMSQYFTPEGSSLLQTDPIPQVSNIACQMTHRLQGKPFWVRDNRKAILSHKTQAIWIFYLHRVSKLVAELPFFMAKQLFI